MATAPLDPVTATTVTHDADERTPVQRDMHGDQQRHGIASHCVESELVEVEPLDEEPSQHDSHHRQKQHDIEQASDRVAVHDHMAPFWRL